MMMGKKYTCIAQEVGSNLFNTADKTLTVKYAPGQPLVTGVGPVTEGSTLSGITCTLPAGQEGYPTTYTYYWTNTESSYNKQTGTGTLSVAGVTVPLHDGNWTCIVGNVVGNGTAAEFQVIVNASPSIKTDLLPETSVLYSTSLLQTCSFKAKPGAIGITWTYNGGSLPAGVQSQLWPNSTSEGKYTITSSTLLWAPGATVPQRRQAGGIYQCNATNGIGSTASGPMNMTILYGPYDISLDQPSPITAVEGGLVTVMCTSDCSPACNFSWTKSSVPGWKRSGNRLSFSDISRDDDDKYKCQALNDYDIKETNIIIIVQYSPGVTVNTTNTTALEQGKSTTLVCSVDSRPESNTILMYNVSSDDPLPTDPSNNRAEYQFDSLDCLYTGQYGCDADNGILTSGTNTTFLDIYCPPRSATHLGNRFGAAFNDTFVYWMVLVANPVPNIDHEDWTFVHENITLPNSLPDNVATSVKEIGHDLMRNITLTVSHVEYDNYGNYSLDIVNSNGTLPLLFSLVPDGPPHAPSQPWLVKDTAVSLLIEWTPGFNGGRDQTFTVLYTKAGTSNEMSALVPGQEVVQYKLDSKHSINSSTTYSIRIMASNDFDGLSEIKGPSDSFTTKALPSFSEETPGVTFTNGEAHITLDLVNLDSVTHILYSVCVMETDNCNTKTVTDLSTSPVIVALPDTGARSLVITATMYDGTEEVNSIEWTEVISDSTNLGLILGVVFGVLAAVALVVIFVVLWRKGILPKKGTKKSSTDNNRLVTNGASAPQKDGFDNPYALATHPDGGGAMMVDDINPYGISGNTVPVGSIEEDISLFGVSNFGAAPQAVTEAVQRSGPNPNDVYAEVKKKKPAAQPEEVVYSQVNKPKPGEKPPPPRKPVTNPDPSQPGTSKTTNRPVSVFPPKRSAAPEPEPVVYAQVNKPPKTPAKEGKKSGGVLGFLKGKGKKGATASAEGQAYENVELNGPATRRQAPPEGTAYANVTSSTEPEGAYSEVQIPRVQTGRGGRGKKQPKLKPFQRIGPDGTIYAELDIIPGSDPGAAGQPPVIHGTDNRTEYASIDIAKLKKSKK